MTQLNAYALTGSVIAALTTWFFLQFPGLLIWCAFIGWACFLQSGGEKKLIPQVIGSMVLGVVMAWIFALIYVSGILPLPGPVLAAILVAIIAPVIILLSSQTIFSIVPASFYGFATCFAFLAQTPEAFTLPAMTSVSLSNALIIVPTSLIIGVGLGVCQTIFAGALFVKQEVEMPDGR